MLPLCYPYRSTGPYGRWLSQPQFVDENTVYIGAVPLYHPIFCSIYLYVFGSLSYWMNSQWTPNGLIADDRFDPRHHSLRTQCHASAHVWRSDEVPMRPPNFLILGIILAYLTIYIILNSSNLRAALKHIFWFFVHLCIYLCRLLSLSRMMTRLLVYLSEGFRREHRFRLQQFSRTPDSHCSWSSPWWLSKSWPWQVWPR